MEADGEVEVGGGGGGRGGGEEWMTPRYSMMKEPGLRSLAAKRPAWPYAGCAGSAIWAIFTRGQGPLGAFSGIESASCGLMCRLARCSGLRLGEYEGFFGMGGELASSWEGHWKIYFLACCMKGKSKHERSKSRKVVFCWRVKRQTPS